MMRNSRYIIVPFFTLELSVITLLPPCFFVQACFLCMLIFYAELTLSV